jgi:hypothetical protein
MSFAAKDGLVIDSSAKVMVIVGIIILAYDEYVLDELGGPAHEKLRAIHEYTADKLEKLMIDERNANWMLSPLCSRIIDGQRSFQRNLMRYHWATWWYSWIERRKTKTSVSTHTLQSNLRKSLS